MMLAWLKELLDTVTIAARLRGIAHALSSAADQIKEVSEEFPDVTPELDAALGGVIEAIEALTRAYAFLQARVDAQEEQAA